MTTLSFFVPCNPPTVTSQQKGASARFGGVRFFKKPAVVKSETSFFELLKDHRPLEPLTGPLKLSIHLKFPWRRSEKKSVLKTYCEMPIETRPDCSNLIKSLEDVMTTLGYWKDDGQIADLRVRKSYADNTGIGVEISQSLGLERRVG